MKYRYRAFISYSHQDDTATAGRWGEWVHRSLESYRVPSLLIAEERAKGRTLPEKIFPVFRDRNELPTADDLQEQIERALDDSEFLIVICSPASARSVYVNAEILYFKRLGREKKILPVIVGGEPNALAKPWLDAEECFPESLQYAIDENGQLSSRRLEPICADARPGKDGREGARLKILAGLLGVGLDQLVRRQDQQQQKQFRFWGTVCILLMSIFAALTLWAMQERKQARRAEAIAVENRIHAEQERDNSHLLLARAHYEDQEFRRADEMMQRIQVENRDLEWRMLFSGYHREEHTWKAHSDRINVLAVTPAGDSVISGDSSGVIHFWDPARRCLTGSIKIGYVAGMDVSADGRLLAVTDSVAGILHLFEIKSRREVRRWIHASNFVPAVRFIAMDRLLTGAGDGKLHLFSVAETAEIQVVQVNDQGITTLDLSPDHSKLAVGGYDNLIHVFTLPGFEPAGVLSGHERQIADLAFHPRDSKLASVSGDYTLRIWSLDSMECLVVCGEHKGFADAVKWMRNGRFLVTGSFDRTIHLRDGDTGRSFRILTGHAGGILDLVALQDGTFISSSHDKTIKEWDPRRSFRLAGLLRREVNGLAVDPENQRLAVGLASGSLEVYALDSTFSLLGACEEGYMPQAYSRDGSFLLARRAECLTWMKATDFSGISTWDGGRQERSFILVRPGKSEILTNGYLGIVMRIGFDEGTAGIVLQSICPPGSVPLAYSPQGDRLAVISPDGKELLILDADDGTVQVRLRYESESPRHAVFNRDGSRIAVIWGEEQLNRGGKDVLQVHDLVRGEVSVRADRFDTWFTKIHYAADDRRILLTSLKDLRVLDAESGRELLQLDIEPAWGEIMAADGSRLLRIGPGTGDLPGRTTESPE